MLPPLVTFTLVTLGSAVLLLPVAFAYDIVKRPVSTWHWLVPTFVALLPLEWVHGLALGFTPRTHFSLPSFSILQLALLVGFGGLTLIAMGVARRLRPEAEVEGSVRWGVLVATVVAALASLPIAWLAPPFWLLPPTAWAAVLFLVLFGVEGGDRVGAARRTGAALLLLIALAAVGAGLLAWLVDALGQAIVVPRASWLAAFAAGLAFLGWIAVLLHRLIIRPAAATLLVVVAPTLLFFLRMTSAAYAVGFVMGGDDLPVLTLESFHASLQGGQSGATFGWGGWQRFKGGAPLRSASTDACQLGRAIPVNRGLQTFAFNGPTSTSVRLRRDEDGWWLGDDGPIEPTKLIDTLRDGSIHELSIVRTPHATFQQVIDVCTVRPDLVCELDPDMSRCGE